MAYLVIQNFALADITSQTILEILSVLVSNDVSFSGFFRIKLFSISLQIQSSVTIMAFHSIYLNVDHFPCFIFFIFLIFYVYAILKPGSFVLYAKLSSLLLQIFMNSM